MESLARSLGLSRCGQLLLVPQDPPAAAMDDPFILTTFAASSLPPTVSAVAYTKSAKEDGRLCVAAHGVGVNVYDVS